jgi:hypothetical protein
VPTTYSDAHRNAAADAITALGNRIGLYAGAARVGTAYADTTWSPAVKVTESNVDKAQSTGSKVTISVPANTLTNGAVIDHYGVHNGSTLLRRIPLPQSITINDATQAFEIDVTPVFKLRGE